jgi:Tol biopolymer transport system component/imidazolonepropionase-like amidohydrolase
MKNTVLPVAVVAGVMAFAPAIVHDQTTYRTISVNTNEVTTPAITIAPDAQSIVFTALGHLYRLPMSGGTAVQLTTGPSYDFDPAISPDGARVAFASNRDGSSSNIFVLDLATKKVTAVAREIDAARPVWSPDGKTIAYARNLSRQDHPMELIPGFADNGLREVRTVPAAGGNPTMVGQPKTIEALFYLPDGRLAWTETERNPGGGMFQTIRQTRVEALGRDGAISALATVAGDPGRVVPSSKGDGVYYGARGAVQWLPFGADTKPSTGARIQDGAARVALTRDDSSVVFGDRGALFRAPLPSGAPERIAFTATMTTDVRPPLHPKWQPPQPSATTAMLRPVLAPALSPNGKRVTFMAGGFLWEQVIGSPAARRLVASGAFARDAVYSPDGRQLAFVASENGRRQLRVFDSSTGQSRSLFEVGGAAWPLYPGWSPDGRRIVFQHTQGIFTPYRILVADVERGQITEITQTSGAWTARPQFSPDGRDVYFTARVDKVAQLYRVAAQANAKPQPMTMLTQHVHEGVVSPDGKWMALRRNSEIWLAPMGGAPVRDEQLKRFSTEGGRSFSFTPDSTGILYTSLGRVWRQPIGGGTRAEISVRATLPQYVAPPLLLQHAKVLDLNAGRFGDDTSLLIQDGRIRWIGSEQAHQIPAGTVRLDAGGRFAIPGLFDSHVHSAWSNQQTNEDAFIAFGVTSVRDTGSTLDLLTALDDRSTITGLPAPRYFYSGEIFEGLMPHWGDAFLQIGTEQEARAEVRNWKARGVDFIKVYPSLPWHLQQVVADEAHRVGLPLVGHGLAPDEVLRHILLGFSSLEHSSSAAYDDILKLAAAAGTSIDPTLSVGGGGLMMANDPDWKSNWRVNEFVPEDMIKNAGNGRGAGAGQTREQLRAAAQPRFDRIMAARRDGVNFLGGTDSLMTGVMFGLSLHWEIAQFVDAGFAPIDALRMATLKAAEQVGASADLGSIAAGKLADLVLLDANPLENIRNTQRIWQVVKGGRVFDPAKLRASAASTTSSR